MEIMDNWLFVKVFSSLPNLIFLERDALQRSNENKYKFDYTFTQRDELKFYGNEYCNLKLSAICIIYEKYKIRYLIRNNSIKQPAIVIINKYLLFSTFWNW